MSKSATERKRAEQFTRVVERLIRDPAMEQEQLETEDLELLATARRVATLSRDMGPVDPSLQLRVMNPVRARGRSSPLCRQLRWGWAAASLAAVMLLVTALTPVGQTALASVLAVFDLGRTKVRITPVETPSAPSLTVVAHGTAVQQRFTLAEAQAEVPFAVPEPGYLPAGYFLREVNGYTYPDLPAWIPQPLFVELAYGSESGAGYTLRIYPIALGDRANISGLNLQAAPIQTVEDVDINGQPGVLLRLGSAKAQAAWQEVVWEHGDLILALSASDLREVDLLAIARSVQ
jgi:hypothetical protein